MFRIRIRSDPDPEYGNNHYHSGSGPFVNKKSVHTYVNFHINLKTFLHPCVYLAFLVY
jgi:hypothetical protein